MSIYEIKDDVAIFHEGVTKIGRKTFKDCTCLKGIIIPASVTEIDANAFYCCTSLESIVVAEGNLVYDSRESCNAIIETKTNTLIYGCKSTIIPESVTEIGESAFYRCASLESIVIPKGVKKIWPFAFSHCTSLTTVTLPVGVNDIAHSVFFCCWALATIYVPAKKADYYKRRLPEDLRGKIVELEPEKKAKK